MSRILVVDDDAGFRASLLETLVSMGHEVVEAADAAGALAELAGSAPDAVILDHRLGQETGTDLLRAAQARFAGRLPPVLVLTAYADTRGTIEAMRLGAFDHLYKPVGREQIDAFLKKAIAARGGAIEKAAATAGDDRFIGSSAAMREVHKLIGRAAASDATVLIMGETGTGKEVAARMLHEFSARATRPFVAVNCAAIPAELLESELFGHARGAFSGATQARIGCFEQADGGTLLLDEIGDMPLAMQAKILRVLQERRVTRLGEAAERVLDVRIIAASHRDIAQMVATGVFRQDLYFRLNVLQIVMPPLRERREDVIALAMRFVDPQRAGLRTFSAGAQELLLAAQWPGNVRQLRNAMERVQVMVPGGSIEASDLAFLETGQAVVAPKMGAAQSQTPMSAAVSSLERKLVASTLAQTQGNRSEAARRLGISRAQLYRKLRALGFDDEK